MLNLLNSKYRTEKLKTRKKRHRNTKNQNPPRRKLSFSKRKGGKCRLTSTRAEQNNDHTRSCFNDKVEQQCK